MEKIKEHDPKKEVYFFKEFEDIAEFVYANAQPEDMVLTMGAGDIYKVGEMMLEMEKPQLKKVAREYKKIED